MIRLAIRCRAEDAERVLAELLELAPGGVEEEYGDGWAEFAVYGPPGELPSLPEFQATVGESLIGVTTTEIPDDWADRWRDFHEPILIADRLCVRPSWEAGAAPPGAVDITIDPGQAFGTGAHHTTRLCLEFLLDLADRGEAHGPLVDLGTGSGVLAIAAAKLGFGPVLGCDSERAAVAAAGQNAAANGVELELELRNLRSERPPPAPTVVANLTAPLLRDVAAAFDISERPCRLISSGLLATEVAEVSAAFAGLGLRAEESRVSGDWAGILFVAE